MGKGSWRLSKIKTSFLLKQKGKLGVTQPTLFVLKKSEEIKNWRLPRHHKFLRNRTFLGLQNQYVHARPILRCV